MNYENRVQAYEREGLTRSDAQSVVDAEDMKASRTMNITPGPWKGGQSIQSESGLFICRVLSSFDGWTHASDKQKFYSSKAPQNSEAEANARAISLLPEMIEALHRIEVIARSAGGHGIIPQRILKLTGPILKQIEG